MPRTEGDGRVYQGGRVNGCNQETRTPEVEDGGAGRGYW